MRVAKPGRVAHPAAEAVVALLTVNAYPGPLARAKTYARAGQVVDVEVGEQEASGSVQGSDPRAYRAQLTAARATCTCPYGCRQRDWCKHALALAFVVADVLDRDAGVRARWTGDAKTARDEAVPPELLERLLHLPPTPDAAAQVTAALDVVPLT